MIEEQEKIEIFNKIKDKGMAAAARLTKWRIHLLANCDAEENENGDIEYDTSQIPDREWNTLKIIANAINMILTTK